MGIEFCVKFARFLINHNKTNDCLKLMLILFRNVNNPL